LAANESGQHIGTNGIRTEVTAGNDCDACRIKVTLSYPQHIRTNAESHTDGQRADWRD